MDDAATMVKAALKERKQALDFGRLIQALAAGSRPNIGSFDEGPAVQRAEAMNAPRVVAAVKALWRTPFAGREWLLITRAAVGAGTTADASWAGALTPVQVLSAEFIEFMRPLSIVDRLDVRKVPFNVGAGRANTGTVARFVGENSPYPVSSMGLDTLKLGIAKVGTIAAFTTELAATRDAAATITSDCAEACAEGLNEAFLDPSRAAVLGVSPASITHGATQIASSGTTAVQIVADAKDAMKAVSAAGIPVSQCTWIMTETLYIHLATMLDTTDEPTWPDLADNGTWLGGLKVLVSGAEYGAASAPEGLLVLVHGPSIAFADAGAIADVSVEASVELDTAPVGGARQLTSLYQNNLVGARITRYCNWARRRDGAVACVHGIAV